MIKSITFSVLCLFSILVFIERSYGQVSPAVVQTLGMAPERLKLAQDRLQAAVA